MRDEHSVIRTPAVIYVNGESVGAFVGETLAASLLAAGYRGFRRSPRLREERGVYCMMGLCQECLVRIDGVRRNACLERVRDGLIVELEC